MNRAALIMSCVAGAAALGGAAVFALPARSDAARYGKRIAGTMLVSGALILAIFAYGLERAAMSTNSEFVSE